MDDFKKAIGSFTLGLLSLPIRIGQGVYRALVLTWFWLWFVVPVTGLHPISLPAAYGLLLVATLFYSFSFAEAEARKKEPFPFASGILLSLTQSSLSWGIGWLAHHFFF